MNDWVPFAYQYGIGGMIFAFGLFLAWKGGALQPSKISHRRLLIMMAAGYLYYFLLHLLWIRLVIS